MLEQEYTIFTRRAKSYAPHEEMKKSTEPRHQTGKTSGPSLPHELPTLCSENTSDGYSAGFSVSSAEVENAFQRLVEMYLSPWIPLTDEASLSTRLSHPITRRLLNSMEVLVRGGAFRVRLTGDGKVRYRVLEHWGQTYRISRMAWTLNLLQEAMEKYPSLRKLKCEFYVNVADSPRSTVDSNSRDLGGIPIFSFRTASSYLDIPVPDPVEYGSNGNYVWKAKERVPYQNRIPKLVFRGSASSLNNYHDDNWLSVPRVRLAALSRQYPELIDAGITKWTKLGKETSMDDVVKSVGTGTSRELSYDEQGRYQFILDLDGGLGSSRKRGILNSGSVPFFQGSNWFMWYEPLLKPFHHFLPVEKYLHDLARKVMHAREYKLESQKTAQRAQCFGSAVVTREAAMLYWKMLLERYSELQDGFALDEEVQPSMCSLRPATAEGPMGCSDGWYVFNSSVPFGCRYLATKRHHYAFECWRNIGRGVELKFVNDPVHDPYG